jgi:hypothetical protein
MTELQVLCLIKVGTDLQGDFMYEGDSILSK